MVSQLSSVHATGVNAEDVRVEGGRRLERNGLMGDRGGALDGQSVPAMHARLGAVLDLARETPGREVPFEARIQEHVRGSDLEQKSSRGAPSFCRRGHEARCPGWDRDDAVRLDVKVGRLASASELHRYALGLQCRRERHSDERFACARNLLRGRGGAD